MRELGQTYIYFVLFSKVQINDNKLKVKLHVQQFKPEDITVKIENNKLTICGKHEKKTDEGHSYFAQEFVQQYTIPEVIWKLLTYFDFSFSLAHSLSRMLNLIWYCRALTKIVSFPPFRTRACCSFRENPRALEMVNPNRSLLTGDPKHEEENKVEELCISDIKGQTVWLCVTRKSNSISFKLWPSSRINLLLCIFCLNKIEICRLFVKFKKYHLTWTKQRPSEKWITFFWLKY